MTCIWYANTSILKIIGYNTWYMYIEKHIKILKFMINIWLILSESKLESYVLKIVKIKKNYKLLLSQ